MKGKVNIFILTILLFSVATLSYNLWRFSLSRILGFLIFAEVLWIYGYKLKKKEFIYIVLSICVFALSFIFAKDFWRNFTDGAYWLITILIILKLNDNTLITDVYGSIKKYNRLIKFIVIIENLILVIGFFVESCYIKAWQGKYYIGFTPSAHTLCSGVCITMVLILIILENKRFRVTHFIWFIPSVIAILQSGARIYLIPLVVIIMIYFKYYIKAGLVRLFLFPLIVTVAVYAFFESGMLDKFRFVMGNEYISKNASAQITSGRTDFWIVDWKAYLQMGMQGKLFGRGFDYVYYINKTRYGLAIWAHNDIIDLLLSVGLFGTMLYCSIILSLCKKIFKNIRKKFTALLMVTYLVVPMIVNGFFTYQHYLYSYVFFIVIMYEQNKSQKRKEVLHITTASTELDSIG